MSKNFKWGDKVLYKGELALFMGYDEDPRYVYLIPNEEHEVILVLKGFVEEWK
jgi:hypothetical protein